MDGNHPSKAILDTPGGSGSSFSINPLHQFASRPADTIRSTKARHRSATSRSRPRKKCSPPVRQIDSVGSFNVPIQASVAGRDEAKSLGRNSPGAPA